VASFALVDRDNPVNKDPTKVIHYEEVQRYLGVADSTGLAPYRLWSAMLESSSGPDTFELNTIGRAVEVVMGVASLPVPHGLRRAKTLPSANLDTGHDAGLPAESLGSAINLALEAANRLDTADATQTVAGDNESTTSTQSNGHGSPSPGVARLKNIVTPQIVDLESML